MGKSSGIQAGEGRSLPHDLPVLQKTAPPPGHTLSGLHRPAGLRLAAMLFHHPMMAVRHGMETKREQKEMEETA